MHCCGVSRLQLGHLVRVSHRSWGVRRTSGVVLCALHRYQARAVVTGPSPYEAYDDRVSRMEIADDVRQRVVLNSFERLHNELKGYTPPSIGRLDDLVIAMSRSERRAREQAAARAEDVMESLTSETASSNAVRAAPKSTTRSDQEMLPIHSTAPLGLYIWGDVGCGKTMLMDLFYENVKVADGRKQRVHYHRFMSNVWRFYHELRTQATAAHRESYDHNLLRPLAKAIAKRNVLMCFDEFQVGDVATAMILGRLFEHLREYGVVCVATSNCTPRDMFKKGMFNNDEAAIVCAAATMTAQFDVIHLESSTDYRMLRTAELRKWNVGDSFYPADPYSECYFQGTQASDRLEACWAHHTSGQVVSSASLAVLGRHVQVPLCTESGVARFQLEDLCAMPLGPVDYLAIATRYHTVFIDGITGFTFQTRDQARRFISLIDALYETNTCLFCSASTTPGELFIDVSDTDAALRYLIHNEIAADMEEQDLYPNTTTSKFEMLALFTGEQERFASRRCISRIAEMRSHAYRTSPHKPHLGVAGLDGNALEFDCPQETSAAPHSTSTLQQINVPTKIDERPRFFGAKHFFGGGWWENKVNR